MSGEISKHVDIRTPEGGYYSHPANEVGIVFRGRFIPVNQLRYEDEDSERLHEKPLINADAAALILNEVTSEVRSLELARVRREIKTADQPKSEPKDGASAWVKHICSIPMDVEGF